MARPGKTVLMERGAISNALSAGTRYFSGANNAQPNVGSANIGGGAFLIEPDDHIGTKLRFRVFTLVNAVAPVADYTVAIYPLTAVAGTVGIVTGTIGATAIPGSSLFLAAPAANSMTRQDSPEFDWPTAGWYVVGITISASTAATSATQWIATLEAR